MPLLRARSEANELGDLGDLGSRLEVSNGLVAHTSCNEPPQQCPVARSLAGQLSLRVANGIVSTARPRDSLPLVLCRSSAFESVLAIF